MDCSCENRKKRVRGDSELSWNSTEAKRSRDDFKHNSSESGPVGSEHVATRVDSEESVSESPEVQRIRNDILDILEDPDMVTDNDPAIQDLDSVIKSFQEEILHPSPMTEPVLVSDSGESQPNLGYLLEASDDELGLPPAISQTGGELVEQLNSPTTAFASEPVDLVGVEGQVPSYDSFEFGVGTENDGSNSDGNNGGLVALGGLFQWDETSDFSEFMWQPESLPAV